MQLYIYFTDLLLLWTTAAAADVYSVVATKAK